MVFTTLSKINRVYFWILNWIALISVYAPPHACLGGFPGGSDSKESTCKAGDMGLIPGLGRSPGKGNGNPLQYSCLGNLMARGAWWATVLGVTTESDIVTKQQQHACLDYGCPVVSFEIGKCKSSNSAFLV